MTMIFVYPPATLSPRVQISAQFHHCLGSAYLIAYLNAHGFKTRQFLADEPINADICVKRILRQQPRIVGFTVYGTNYTICQLLARKLKETDPSILILFGGPTPTVQGGIVLEENRFVDITVQNEGEETVLELLNLLDGVDFNMNKAGLEKVKGICYREGKQVIKSPPRNVFSDHKETRDYLDKYPSPYISGILTTKQSGIITARGCNQHCVYCNCAVMSKRCITTHSVDRVIAELDYISKTIADDHSLDIFDDAFTLLPDRAIEICRRIIEEKINLPLTCATRCDRISEELLDKMKEAGFKAVGFSLESAVPRVLRAIGKMQPPNTESDPNYEKEREFIEKFKHYVTYARKIGIEVVYASIMVGLPTETPEDAEETLRVIETLGGNLDFYAHNVFQVFPGTPISITHRKYGLGLEPFDNRIHYRTIHPYDTTRLKLVPNANLISDGISMDKVNTRHLALAPSITEREKIEFFNKVILCSDVITEELVLWLQDYLAVNGILIQVYSCLETAKKYHFENEQVLSRCISPTNYHAGYYRVQGDNGPGVLVPVRKFLKSPQCGMDIHLLETKKGLTLGGLGTAPVNSVCIDKDVEDVRKLHGFLEELAQSANTAEELLEHPLYPYFSSLCRWEEEGANCRTLETVIVDADFQVKTCWNGNPAGKVGMPLSEILKNLEKLRIQSSHNSCVFPEPMKGDEYKKLREGCPLWEPVELLRNFDLFKVFQRPRGD